MDLEESGQESGTPARFAALFLCVWCIYLFDRLYDAIRSQPPGPLSLRHDWARSHLRALMLLAAASGGTLLFAILPALDGETLRAGLVPALLTIFYYVTFRFTGWYSRIPIRFPGKEFMIGICFCLGILVATRPEGSSVGKVFLAAGLVLLFSGNCLLISRAEENLDRRSDRASHFSKPGPKARLPESLLVAAILIGLVLSFGGAYPLASVGLITCGILSLSLALANPNRLKPFTQGIADGFLMVPWILVCARSLA